MTWWLRHIGWWPPLLGTGIKVTRLDKDLRAIDVEMPLRPWNRNYVGVQFGGSLFAMTDPFYMIMLATNLGREYVVWDKAASIRYKRPGTGRVRAEFRLSEERLVEIRRALENDGRYDARFLVEVKDAEGGVVAEVERVIYCATKDAHAERKKLRDGLSECGS
jgi:acyl-coenzyme A thioesterase PaaI-like protein